MYGNCCIYVQVFIDFMNCTDNEISLLDNYSFEMKLLIIFNLYAETGTSKLQGNIYNYLLEGN